MQSTRLNDVSRDNRLSRSGTMGNTYLALILVSWHRSPETLGTLCDKMNRFVFCYFQQGLYPGQMLVLKRWL